VAVYFLFRFSLPSVTIVNKSDSIILNARVELPNSGLDFGQVGSEEENTIHYSLEQSDGSYHYKFTLENGQLHSGACGYVTNNDINKRLIIKVYNKEVICG